MMHAFIYFLTESSLFSEFALYLMYLIYLSMLIIPPSVYMSFHQASGTR